MYSIDSEDTYKDQFWELMQSENAVLFLGQDYQHIFYDSELFRDRINVDLCNSHADSNAYDDLWKQLSIVNKTVSNNSRKSTVSEEQLLAMQKISAQLPESNRLSDVINAGWSSIVTSAIDDAINRHGGLKTFYPIYDPNTRVPGLGNKRKLHISYLFGCVCESNTVITTVGYNAQASDNARNMFMRVRKDAIPYSGMLVIDGWNPENDWFNAEDLLGSFDYNMPFPRVYIFSATEELIDELKRSRRLTDLLNEGAIYYSEHSFYDSFWDRLQDIESEDEHYEEDVITIDFIADHRNKSIDIPRHVFRAQDTDHIHILTKEDRQKQPLNNLGIQGITISFLANDRNNFPLWQGYCHGCYFDRDIYCNNEKPNDELTLKGAVLNALRSNNLHETNNMIVLQGHSNSGKSILLGKLAIDLSNNYPVIYINGELAPDGRDSTKSYEKFVDFVTNYIAKPCVHKRANRGRSLIIWDNNQLTTNLQEYYELRRELAESNAVLVVSAYLVGQTKRTTNSKSKVTFIELNNELRRDTEVKALSEMLSANLGKEYTYTITKLGHTKRSNTDKPQFINTADTQLLYLLRRLFQAESKETRPIYDQSGQRTVDEVSTNKNSISEMLQKHVDNTIDNINKEYNIDRAGLLSVLNQIVTPEQMRDVWYKEVEECAPILNDITAIAGQFGLRLPLSLIQNVLVDLCPNSKYYMPDIEYLLSASSMIEYPFPVDIYGQKLIGYRSIEEATTYLDTNYTRRQKHTPIASIDDCSCREDRELFLLMKIIEHGDIAEYWGSGFARAQIVKNLLDQFTPNSYLGQNFARDYQYRYDTIADCIMKFGGQLNPEFALTAAYLRREKRIGAMLSAIKSNHNIDESDKNVLDIAASDLERAIEIETLNGNQLTGSLMRLYVEWCCNRNYTLNREKPSKDDLLVFRQIHSYFSKALTIYLRRDDNLMKPTAMLDVYLNGFDYFSHAMECLYKVQSNPSNADPDKLYEFNDELQFALNVVVSKLLVNNPALPSDDFVEKLQRLYSLAHRSIDILERRASAKGINAFTLLRARYIWCDSMFSKDDSLHAFSAETVNKDLFLESDYSESCGVTRAMASAAERIYNFFKQNKYITILTSNREKTEIELSCLEMLIKSTWIKITGNMPFTRDQSVRLTKEHWNELHIYCNTYCNNDISKANYGFAYFLEGIYSWLFTPDTPNKFDENKSPSDKYFYKLTEYCYRPKELPKTDSVFVLTNPETLQPMIFESNVELKRNGRYEASIIGSVNRSDLMQLPYLVNRNRIYCAPSLYRDLNSYSGINKTHITIRFNLKGPLAGPAKDEK